MSKRLSSLLNKSLSLVFSVLMFAPSAIGFVAILSPSSAIGFLADIQGRITRTDYRPNKPVQFRKSDTYLPMIPVTFSNAKTGQSVRAECVLDTGATTAMASRSLMDKISAPISRRNPQLSYTVNGVIRTTTVRDVDLEIGDNKVLNIPLITQWINGEEKSDKCQGEAALDKIEANDLCLIGQSFLLNYGTIVFNNRDRTIDFRNSP